MLPHALLHSLEFTQLVSYLFLFLGSMHLGFRFGLSTHTRLAYYLQYLYHYHLHLSRFPHDYLGTLYPSAHLSVMRFPLAPTGQRGHEGEFD